MPEGCEPEGLEGNPELAVLLHVPGWFVSDDPAGRELLGRREAVIVDGPQVQK
jgi:hypothetical protein